MPSYLATWSVIVVGDDDTTPLEAARIAREMADDHKRSLWNIEETETGDMATVNLRDGSVLLCCEEV